MNRPGDLALLMNIAADTGLRLGEIGRLTTLDIVLDVNKGTGAITARSRKQSRKVTVKERHVPFDGVLVDWRAGLPGRRLFHECAEDNFRADVYRALDAATRGTKFFCLRPLLLRHALRTNMYEAGVDEILIDAYLGHTAKEMGEHYRHIRTKHLLPRGRQLMPKPVRRPRRRSAARRGSRAAHLPTNFVPHPKPMEKPPPASRLP